MNCWVELTVQAGAHKGERLRHKTGSGQIIAEEREARALANRCGERSYAFKIRMLPLGRTPTREHPLWETVSRPWLS